MTQNPENQPPLTPKSLRGCLEQYAKPELIDQEQNIWQTAVIEKYQYCS